MEHKYFCPTVFKNSPKCPNDDQMFGKTVNLTNEFRRTMPNDLVILWSKFIKSLHLPGLNFQNSCWHMKIDRINRCFADFPSSYISTWKLLSIQVKKRKETISKDFSKLHPISWFFSLFQSFQSPATYPDKDQQLSVLEFDGCYDSCSTATISVGRIFTTLSIFDILLCRYFKPLHVVSGGFGFVK